MELESWKAEFEGKKVLIWGYGMEGKSSYAFIRSLLPDQKLMIADSGNEDRLEKIRKETSDTEVLSDAAVDFSEYDLILKSPGIVITEGFPKEHLSGEAQLFLKHYRNQVIGVTGTKGKSTTTSLVHAVLSEKYRTHLVGNIGKACFDVIPDMQEGDLAAFELSCHQLEFCPYSPHAAVYLNLFEEHLDHYGTLERYGAAKANIFRHQQKGDLTILNQNLPYCREVADAILIGKDIRAEGNHLIVPGHEIDVNDCRLIGSHNYLNLAVAYEIGLRYGISDSQFLHAAANFQPLHHRLEDLGEYHGIRYVNDSISTIGQSCIQALKTLPETDTVLVGGMDRGIEYQELEDYLASRKNLHIIFMYATGKRIYEELKEQGRLTDNMVLTDDLSSAMAIARTATRPHHICLLSPAASSYDHFRNFEERGDVFARMAKDEL